MVTLYWYGLRVRRYLHVLCTIFRCVVLHSHDKWGIPYNRPFRWSKARYTVAGNTYYRTIRGQVRVILSEWFGPVDPTLKWHRDRLGRLRAEIGYTAEEIR